LLVAHLLPPVEGRHGQGRSLLRRPDRRRGSGLRNGARDCPARPQPREGRRRRRGLDAAPARAPASARLRNGAGLLLLEAVAGGRSRPARVRAALARPARLRRGRALTAGVVCRPPGGRMLAPVTLDTTTL